MKALITKQLCKHFSKTNLRITSPVVMVAAEPEGSNRQDWKPENPSLPLFLPSIFDHKGNTEDS